MLDKRFTNLIMIVDTMAQKYNKLPSEILQNATTQDLSIHIHAETQRSRERAKERGDVHNMYSQSEILERYNKVKNV